MVGFPSIDVAMNAEEEKAAAAAKPVSSRQVCGECRRPARVCWCGHLVSPPVRLSSRIRRVVILQHPKERKRPHQTARMAARGIADDKCLIKVGTKVKDSDNDDLLNESDTYVMFPNAESKDVAELAASPSSAALERPLTLVVLDGTWDEAKKLLARSPALKRLPSVHLDLGDAHKSAFVIKTQPNPQCLSTVETVAHSLAIIEGDNEIITKLLRPLHAICRIQLSHGAVLHDDKLTKNNTEVP